VTGEVEQYVTAEIVKEFAPLLAQVGFRYWRRPWRSQQAALKIDARVSVAP
jgi:hypothetical protein